MDVGSNLYSFGGQFGGKSGHSSNLRLIPEENLRIVHLVGMTSCPEDVPLKKSIEFTPSGPNTLVQWFAGAAGVSSDVIIHAFTCFVFCVMAHHRVQVLSMEIMAQGAGR